MSCEGTLWAHRKSGVIYVSGEISELTTAYLAHFLHHMGGKPANIFIHSGGGEDDSGFAMYDLISLYPGHVTGNIVGVCESAALLPFLACDTRHMSPLSRLQIHHGTYEIPRTHQREAITDAKELSYRDKLFMQIVTQRTNLTLAQVRKYARFGAYFTAEEALEFGMITSIINSPKVDPLS